jgi:RHS repeat-associated protein
VGSVAQSYAYPPDSHRLQSVAGEPRSYTAAGNASLIDGLTLEYSGFNRLITIPGQRGARQRNLYNGRGEREFRESYNLPRHFGYDESGRLLFETEGVPGVPSSTVRQRYLWLDDQPIAVKNSSDAYAGEWLHIHADHLGSPRAITRPNASNAVVWRWALEGSAFGQHPAQADVDGDGVSLEFNLRYPGQYFDSATGWHYNYFRDYEPGTGRYVQSDPIGLGGGVSTYGYGGGAPLDFFDRWGLFNMTAQEVFDPHSNQYVWNYTFSFSSCSSKALHWFGEQTAGRLSRVARRVGQAFDLMSPGDAGDADILDLERRCECLGYDPQLEDFFESRYGNPSRSLSEARASQALADLRGELGRIRRLECQECANDSFYDWDRLMEKARARGTRSIHRRAREIANQ